VRRGYLIEDVLPLGLLMVTATMSGPIILPGTNQRQANQRVAMGLEPEPEPAPNAPARASGAAAGVADMDVDVEGGGTVAIVWQTRAFITLWVD